MKFYTVLISAVLILPQICCGQQSARPKAGHNDTIPGKRLILYQADAVAAHDRQTLYLQNLSRLMKMPSLNNSKEQFYVRIWIWNFKEKFVINIRKDKSGETCETTGFDQRHPDSNYYIAITHEWKNLTPGSGWNSFLDTLNRYEIPSLNSGKPGKDYKDRLTHAIYIQFEVVQAGKYRFYEYLEPAFYRYVEPGAMNVYRFLRYFEKEMNIRVYAIGDNLYAKPD
jgi:hypothetical protein